MAPARGPEPGEAGWKETIQMHPGECTTLLVYVEEPLPGRKVLVPGATHYLRGCAADKPAAAGRE